MWTRGEIKNYKVHIGLKKWGVKMIGREVDFTTDKYNKPHYLSKRESIAQIILNGLFMKKGNSPGHPDRGVDIESYLFKPQDSIDELQLLTDLKNTCGENAIGNDIESLTFQVVTFKGKEYALLMIKLKIDNNDDLLAISIEKVKKNIIRYQYNFISEDVPV